MPWDWWDWSAAPLVGAEGCKRRPPRCDLSRAVTTDDATGTIVFHLERPSSDFLRQLMYVAPIPRGTPDRDLGTRPVPSTGPYMIESYVPKRALTLVRNPYFDVWSSVARPDGFPDEIELRLGPRDSGVKAVEEGRADVASAPLEKPEEFAALEDFRARFASQSYVHALQATVLLYLNTAHPPFDDVRVRRAVNYAVDRGEIAASYGRGLNQPTCQLRPPGTVGFQRYCPYTAAPSRSGEWKAPDLTRARALVAASGTRGMRVTVWTYPGFWEQAAAASVRALADLGYRATIRRTKNIETLQARATDKKTQGLQAGMIGWYGVPRAASSLLTGLTCSANDWSFFCDRKVDARMMRALELEATDQDVAARGTLAKDRARYRRSCALGSAVHACGRRRGLRARGQLSVQPGLVVAARPALGALDAESWQRSRGSRELQRLVQSAGRVRRDRLGASRRHFARPRNRLRARALGDERPSPGSASSQVEWRIELVSARRAVTVATFRKLGVPSLR